MISFALMRYQEKGGRVPFMKETSVLAAEQEVTVVTAEPKNEGA